MASRTGRAVAKKSSDPPAALLAPPIHRLGRAKIDRLLGRNHVGRIAYSFHGRVDIEPIHYVLDGEDLCLRTSPGSKLTVVQHNPWVAFEVDEIQGLFEWQSVVLHGTLYLVEDADDAVRHATYLRTLERLRDLLPDTFRANDPVPFRHVLYRLHIAEAEGRQATPLPARASRPAASRPPASRPAASRPPASRRS